MGYSMSMKEAEFHMTSEQLPGARKALLDFLFSNPDLYHWINRISLRLSQAGGGPHLKNLLEDADWEIQFNDEGDVIKISFVGEKAAGAETKLFSSIAPFVKPDSYIEMTGERGELWRWVFDGTECREVKPKIIWE